MKSFRRALRRHHRRRMLRHALRVIELQAFPWERNPEWRIQSALRRRDNLRNCSCYLCNHSRGYLGPTCEERQQLRAALAEYGPEDLPAVAELKGLWQVARR